MATRKISTRTKIYKKYYIISVIAFACIGVITLLVSHASTGEVSTAIEAEQGTLTGCITKVQDNDASSGSAINFCKETQQTTWTWPATLQNTGPATGTKFTIMEQRDFTPADNGKIFDGIQINATDPRGIYITASNITFKNCKIIYTGTVTSQNGFLFFGNPSDKSIRPQNIKFDHCIIDDGNKFEYNVRAYYAQFNISYSQVRGGSHNIDSGGDLNPDTTISLFRNYIYDYDDKPFDSVNRYQGHAANVYFTGNNGTVNIEENTIIGNRWEACTSGGFSNGPGAGCRDNSSNPPFNGTGSVVVYADEDSNPDKQYIVKHNQISGSSYYPIRFYGGNVGIESIQILNNVYTAQSGYPTFSIEGGIYAFDKGATNRTISGNSWGKDTVCYSNASACAGTPNN